MKAIKYVVVCWALGTLILLAPGCVEQSPDMIRSGQLSLEKTGIVGVNVMWAQVRQEGDLAVVTGSVIPKGASLRRYLGHIYIEFFDSNGTLVGKAQSKPFWVITPGTKGGPRHVRFRVESETIVPIGGKVLVAYRRGSRTIEPESDF